MNRRFHAKRANIKNCIFSILVIDSIQILHGNKDLRGCPNMHMMNPRWRASSILQRKSINRNMSATS